MRQKETIDRASFLAMLENMDGDDQDKLLAQLAEWQGSSTCEEFEVSLDSTGRLDSESNPCPA